MGDQNQRSPTLDLHSFFKMPKSKSKSLKDMGKAYKSLVSKKNNHAKKTNQECPDFEQNDNTKRVDEDIWSPSFLSRTGSRRSKTPTPETRPLMSRTASRRCTTPTPTPTSLSRTSSSRKSATDVATSLKRIMSRRGSSSSLSRSDVKLEISEPELIYHAGSPTNDMGIRSSMESANMPGISLLSSLSRRATTPIIFSQTTARKKPPEIEKTIECSLEDLCFGCTKKIRVTRDVIKYPGVILQEEEILKIKVEPGWRKGTKITFEGKGDEKPGYLPADIVFLIDEKKHPLFRRDGSNLEICVEIRLVDALTGCCIEVPVLGGENMNVSFENTVICPGYEKVVQGQGMPTLKNDGTRGDLHVKFLIEFPTQLSHQQRKEAVSILEDCCE